MSEIRIFENLEFGKVRTVEIDNEVCFIAKDIAVMLGYGNPQQAVRIHCKKAQNIGVLFGSTLDPQTVIIPESDVYRLVIRSTLESAVKIQDWLVDDVLPTIRKHGAYLTESTIEDVLTDPDLLIGLATQLKEERRKRKELEEYKALTSDKVLFADSVEASANTIRVRDLAKLASKSGIDIGEKRLYNWLRDKKLIEKYGTMPTQTAIDLKIFEVSEGIYYNSRQEPMTTRTTRVTGKGQQYILKKLHEEAAPQEVAS